MRVSITPAPQSYDGAYTVQGLKAKAQIGTLFSYYSTTLHRRTVGLITWHGVTRLEDGASWDEVTDKDETRFAAVQFLPTGAKVTVEVGA